MINPFLQHDSPVHIFIEGNKVGIYIAVIADGPVCVYFKELAVVYPAFKIAVYGY
jgi:hypothetical protein